MVELLKKDLIVDYTPLLFELQKSSFKEDSCVFCAQWGDKIFEKTNDSKIFIVGRAVNGWVNDVKDINLIFGDTEKKLFNREDQLIWVDGRWTSGTPLSAFWRVSKNVINSVNPNSNVKWYENVAWSNLFKIAPHAKGWNPSRPLINLQRQFCISILKKEIKYFNPDIVIMFTGGWEGYFLKALMGLDMNDKLPPPTRSLAWGGKYTSKLFEIEIEGVKKKFIISEHPMAKKEAPHVEAILSLLRSS